MLVLRRKVGEAIVLNQVIVIRVLGVEGDRVKLGIDAPPDVVVVREELLDDEQKSATPAQYQPRFPTGDNVQVYHVRKDGENGDTRT